MSNAEESGLAQSAVLTEKGAPSLEQDSHGVKHLEGFQSAATANAKLKYIDGPILHHPAFKLSSEGGPSVAPDGDICISLFGKPTGRLCSMNISYVR